MALHHKDGGLASRKYHLTLLAMATFFGAAVLAGKWASFGSYYNTLINGILMVLGLYFGANVGNSLVVSKMKPPAEPDADEDPKEKP